MLFAELTARSGHAVPLTEYREVFLQRLHAGVADRQILDLGVPDSGCGIPPGVGFRHLLQNHKAFGRAIVIKQQLRQRILQCVIARTAGVNRLELIDRLIAAGRNFCHRAPVLHFQVAFRRVALE